MICPSCYREIPPGGIFCTRCGARIAPPVAVPAPEGPNNGAWSNPWEERAGRGPGAAFAETLQQALFHPVAFFRGTAPESGAGAALLYAVLVGSLSIAVVLLWQSALGERLAPEPGARWAEWGGGRIATAALLLVVPVAIAVACIVSAGVQHLTLALLGGAHGTYRATLKAVCYSSSALAFNVFPVCGSAVGAVWQAVIQVIGLRELHRTTTARALWALLLPFMLALCLAGAVFFATMLGLVKFMMEFGDGRYSA